MKKAVLAACIGATIMFPTTPTKAEYHVRPGDTFYKIAAEHEMELQDLIKLNPHIANANKIKPRDQLVVRSADTVQNIIDYAMALSEVTVYQYGGQDAPLRTDCSGWVQSIYREFGIDLPRVSRDQAKVGKSVKFQDLQRGDLMFFSTRADKVITHVGIYMGGEKWISNLNTKKSVEILSTWGPWTQRYFLWAQRVI
jgi:peptidoglycan DL-endopeptidase LytE